jgi:hypothetical protein
MSTHRTRQLPRSGPPVGHIRQTIPWQKKLADEIVKAPFGRAKLDPLNSAVNQSNHFTGNSQFVYDNTNSPPKSGLRAEAKYSSGGASRVTTRDVKLVASLA